MSKNEKLKHNTFESIMLKISQALH